MFKSVIGLVILIFLSANMTTLSNTSEEKHIKKLINDYLELYTNYSDPEKITAYWGKDLRIMEGDYTYIEIIDKYTIGDIKKDNKGIYVVPIKFHIIYNLTDEKKPVNFELIKKNKDVDEIIKLKFENNKWRLSKALGYKYYNLDATIRWAKDLSKESGEFKNIYNKLLKLKDSK